MNPFFLSNENVVKIKEYISFKSEIFLVSAAWNKSGCDNSGDRNEAFCTPCLTAAQREKKLPEKNAHVNSKAQ